MMTEHKAWLYLAKGWNDNSFRGYGLCICIFNLCNNCDISFKTHSLMLSKIYKYGDKHELYGYFWTKDDFGSKERCKFCLERAKQIKRYNKEK